MIPSETIPRGGEIYAGAEAQRWMANNLSEYLDKLPLTQCGATLYPRQVMALRKLASFTRKCTNARQDIGGYFDLHTGFGKTFLMRAIAEGCDIGHQLPDGTTARGALIAPTTTILDDLATAFNEAPFETTRWYGPHKNAEGDMLIISDDGFRSLHGSQREAFLAERRLVMLDESHTKLGPDIRGAVQRIKPGRITLGFGGSGDYHPGKRTTHLLGTEIDRYTTLDAIEDGNLRPLQLFAFDTGVRAPRNSNESNATKLRDSKERNQLILDLVAFAVESGRQGLASCIDGDQCAHANNLAAAASQLKIFDQALRRPRLIVAEAVHGYKKPREIRDSIARYRAGKVDVIFHHGMVGMGFHSERTDFVVHGKPYRSYVEMTQHTGRVLEPEDSSHGLVFELIDQNVPGPRALSFGLLGVNRIGSGFTTVGPVSGRQPRPPGAKKAQKPTIQLPPALAARTSKFSGKLVRELFLEKRKVKTEAVPDNMKALGSTPLAEIVRDEKWTCAITDAYAIERRRYNRKWHIANMDEETLPKDALSLPDFLTCPRVKLRMAARRLGLTADQLAQYIRDNSIITIAVPNTRKTRTYTTIPETELARLDPNTPGVPFDPKIDALIEPIRTHYNLNPSRIRGYCTSRTVDGIPQSIPLYHRRTEKGVALCVNVLHAATLNHHFQSRVPEAAVRMSDLHTALGGLALPDLRRLLAKKGVDRYLETAYSPDTNDEIGPPIQFLPYAIGNTVLTQLAGEDAAKKIHSVSASLAPESDLDSGQDINHPEKRSFDNFFTIPSLSVDIRAPLTAPNIAVITKKTLQEVEGVIKTLAYSPNIERVSGKDRRITYQLRGQSLDEILIRLVGLSLDDAAHRLCIPRLLVDRTVGMTPPSSEQRLTLDGWSKLLKTFPFPPHGWYSVYEAADTANKTYYQTLHFAKRFGANVRDFYDSAGKQQPYISGFFFDLLAAQNRIGAFHKPPNSLPHNWITMQKHGITAQEFNTWAAQAGIPMRQLYTTRDEGQFLALPHFSNEHMHHFIRYRQNRRRGK